MFRKFTLAALPAAVLAMTLFANVDSASQAFAKGGSGSRNGSGRISGRGRDFHRDFRHRGYDRYYGGYFGWGYPSFAYAVDTTCPECVIPAAVPVAEAPVCTTCEPVVAGCESCGRGYWGYDRHFRHGWDRGHRGPSGHGKR